MVALDTVVGGTAVRYRAAGYAGTWLDETAEPRCEGGIGIWRRVGHRRAGEQYHRGKEEWPHHPRRRLSEGAHAIHDLRPGRRDARLEQPAAMPKALRPTMQEGAMQEGAMQEGAMQERGRSNAGCAQAVPLREPSVGVFTTAMIKPISRAIRASVSSAERPGR